MHAFNFQCSAADGTVDQHQHSTLNRPKTVAHLEHHVVAVQRDISRARVAAHAWGRLLGSDKPGQASQKHHNHRCSTSDRKSFEKTADQRKFCHSAACDLIHRAEVNRIHYES